MGFDASTLQLKSVYNTTPNLDTDANAGESGIWMSGAGIASDGTQLFVITGNGDFNPAVGDYGDTILQVHPDTSTAASPNINGYGLATTDYFTPYNQQALADADADLGSGGAMLIPSQPGTTTSELVAAGKQGIVYLINVNNMGHYAATGTINNDLQEVSLGHGIWGSPAYFNASVYFHAVGDVLKRFALSNGTLSAAPAAQSTIAYNSQGGTPSISANGSANGIAWDLQWDASHQVLHAYDATTLAELYNSNQNAARDQETAGIKFITPTIADGEVFVGGNGMLYIYGLLKPVTTPPNAPSNLTASTISAATINLAWVDNADNESSFEIQRSTDNASFSTIATAQAPTPSPTPTPSSAPTPPTITASAPSTSSAPPPTPPPPWPSPPPPPALPTSTTSTPPPAPPPSTPITTTTPSSPAQPSLNGSPEKSATHSPSPATASSTAPPTNPPSPPPTTSLPLLGSTATFDVWIKTTQTGSNNHFQAPAITGVEQNSGTNDINWGTLDATGHIGLYVGNSGGVYSTNPVNDGQWHNIAMTRDANTGLVQIFIDGILNASTTLATGNLTSSFFLIGALTDVATDGVTKTGANFFNGALDEIRIYNQVLGLSEIVHGPAPRRACPAPPPKPAPSSISPSPPPPSSPSPSKSIAKSASTAPTPPSPHSPPAPPCMTTPPSPPAPPTTTSSRPSTSPASHSPPTKSPSCPPPPPSSAASSSTTPASTTVRTAPPTSPMTPPSPPTNKPSSPAKPLPSKTTQQPPPASPVS